MKEHVCTVLWSLKVYIGLQLEGTVDSFLSLLFLERRVIIIEDS